MRPELLARLLKNWPIKILSVAAAVVLVLFNGISGLENRVLSVGLEQILPPDALPSQSLPERVRVTLRGETEEIVRVLEDDLRVYIDFSAHSAGAVTAPILVERRGDALLVDPLEINVEPDRLNVVLEQRITRTIAIEPSFSGTLPHGYELVDFRLSPATVEIDGPASVVEIVDEIKTETIELLDRRDDFFIRAALISPDPLVSFLATTQTDLQVQIAEETLFETFEQLETIVLDLRAGLSIGSALPSGSAQARGQLLALEQITTSQFTLIIDAASITRTGEYLLPVRLDAPDGLFIVDYEPRSVLLNVVGDNEQ